jgi:hypothetical protein
VSRRGGSGGWIVAALLTLAVHPGLWVVALRQTRRLARPGWWYRPPFLPIPDRDYLRFRMVTQYGDPTHVPTPEDLVAYLTWCRYEP